VQQNAFFGWPDYVTGKPVTDAAFAPSRSRPPQPLWQEHPPAQEPLLTLEPHASATQIEVCRNPAFAAEGLLFVAASGDQSPVTAAVPVRAGYWVKSVDPKSGRVETFFTAKKEALGPKDLEYVTTAGRGGWSTCASIRRGGRCTWSTWGRCTTWRTRRGRSRCRSRGRA